MHLVDWLQCTVLSRLRKIVSQPFQCWNAKKRRRGSRGSLYSTIFPNPQKVGTYMVELEIKRRIQPCRLDLLRADGRSLQSEKWRNVHLWQRILKKLPEMKTWFPVHRLVSSSRFVWYHPRSDRSENKGTLYSKPKSIPPFWPPSTNYKCGVRVP